jgi:glyoxylate reductase
LITRRIPQAAIDVLGASCALRTNDDDRQYPPEELAKHAAGADAIVALLTDRVDEALLAAAPSVRVVANVAVGYDNIDLEAAKRHGVVITNTPGVLTDATADFAMTLLLAVGRRVVQADRYIRDGRFTGWDMGMFLGADFAGKTLGLAGFGRIGQAVAQRAIGFGLRIIYTDEVRFAADIEERYGATYVDKGTLLRESDFLSLHVPLTADTRHYLGAPELALMKPGAYVINTARGPAIDEPALVAALQAGRLAGAGLDVFEREPQLAEGLAALENVVLAPHIASAGRETRERMALVAARNVLAVLAGDQAPNRVV